MTKPPLSSYRYSMPARSYPAQPLFADQSEKEVWQALIEQLPADAAVVCNLKILDTYKHYEIDFIVLVPEVGIAVIEVKGGNVTPNEARSIDKVALLEAHPKIAEKYMVQVKAAPSLIVQKKRAYAQQKKNK